MKKGLFVILCAIVLCLPFTVVKANEMTEIKNSKELINLVEDNWDKDYYGEIILEKGSNQIEKDGEKDTFSNEFAISTKEAKAVTKSAEKVEDFLEKEGNDQIYNVTEEKGQIVIQSPYQTKRLIVNCLLKEADYMGATAVYKDEEYKQTILQYETEEEASKACDVLNKIYKKEVAFPDLCLMSQTQKTNNAKIHSVADPRGTQSWGISYMGLDALKKDLPEEYRKNKVTVAVIDTGYNPDNYLLEGRKISKYSKSFRANKKHTSLRDSVGHGSHVTGIIAEGTTSNVELMPLPITNNKGETTTTLMGEAVKYAIGKKVHVINMSMGGLAAKDKQNASMNPILNKAYNQNVIVVLSAGNEKMSTNYIYPANSNKALTISSINSDHECSAFSNFGSAIDFCAPGEGIWSAGRVGKYSLAKMDGTSMAAPHITAAVAMLKSTNPNMSFQQVKSILKKYSYDLGKPGRDDYCGEGVPQIYPYFFGKIAKDTTKKAIPSDVKLTSCKLMKSGKVKLTWTKSKDADSYVIYRKEEGSFYKKAKTVKGASHTSAFVDLPKFGAFYSFVVEAYQDGYYSKSSNSLTTIKVTKPKVQYKRQAKGLAVQVKDRNIFSRIPKKGAFYQVQVSSSRNFKRHKNYKLKPNPEQLPTIDLEFELIFSNKKINSSFWKTSDIVIMEPKTYNAPTKKTLTGPIAGKKCYVRVRSVYKKGGKIYRSAWTKIKHR